MRRDDLLPAATKALFDSDLVATRIVLALAEYVWAILLMWPGGGLLFTRPTYLLMSHVMPQEAWAFVFLLMAIMQTTIVLTESFHHIFAQAFAGLNAGVWVFVVAAMLLSVYPPPAAIGGEIALAIGAVWIWLRPIILMRGIVNARRERA